MIRADIRSSFSIVVRVFLCEFVRADESVILKGYDKLHSNNYTDSYLSSKLKIYNLLISGEY